MFECQSQNILQVSFCFPANSLNKTLHLYIQEGSSNEAIWSAAGLIWGNESCFLWTCSWKTRFQIHFSAGPHRGVSRDLQSLTVTEWMCKRVMCFWGLFEISAKLKRCFCSHCKCKKLFDPWACSPIHPTSSILVVLQFKINLIYLVLGLGASPLTEVLFD